MFSDFQRWLKCILQFHLSKTYYAYGSPYCIVRDCLVQLTLCDFSSSITCCYQQPREHSLRKDRKCHVPGCFSLRCLRDSNTVRHLEKGSEAAEQSIVLLSVVLLQNGKPLQMTTYIQGTRWLKLQRVTFSDFGSYSCNAKNTVGEVESRQATLTGRTSTVHATIYNNYWLQFWDERVLGVDQDL